MKKLIILFFLTLTTLSFGQRKLGLSGAGSQEDDKISKTVKIDTAQKPPITACKIISSAGDTTYVDTTLTIQKYYKFNYLRKDNFELLPFSNVGQTYNSLAYNLKGEDLIPEFGARARHFNFMEVEEICFYAAKPSSVGPFLDLSSGLVDICSSLKRGRGTEG